MLNVHKPLNFEMLWFFLNNPKNITGPLWNHDERLPNFAVRTRQVVKLFFGVVQRQLGHAQPAIGVANTHGDLQINF